jgi:hypothetical protein
MQSAPIISDPENLPVAARPVRDAFASLDEICQAILESRVHFVNTVTGEFGKDLALDTRIVIDPPNS